MHLLGVGLQEWIHADVALDAVPEHDVCTGRAKLDRGHPFGHRPFEEDGADDATHRTLLRDAWENAWGNAWGDAWGKAVMEGSWSDY